MLRHEIVVVVCIFIMHGSHFVGGKSNTVVLPVTVFWEHGSSSGNCSSMFDHMILGNTKKFACSRKINGTHYPIGDWNNGSQSFIDPVEKFRVNNLSFFMVAELLMINATLNGTFCSNRPKHDFSVFIGQPANFTLLGQVTLPSATLPNVWKNCDGSCITFQQTVDGFGPFDNYVFGANNTIAIRSEDDDDWFLCLHAAAVQFQLVTEIKLWLVFLSSALAGGSFVAIISAAGYCYHYHKLVKPALPPSTRNSEYITLLGQKKGISMENVEIIQKIGRGSFGDVVLAKWRGMEVAIKFLPEDFQNDATLLKNFQKEAYLMSSLSHPNCVAMLGACVVPPDLCIIMEYMPNGSLHRVLHEEDATLPWSVRKDMMMDASAGIIYLHNSVPVIIHRDLKPQNLLVDQHWRIKVADFGMSRILANTDLVGAQTLTAVGTPSYAAPEILENKERYTEKVDVYSFGIILWEVATRSTPYPNLTPYQVIIQVSAYGARPEFPFEAPPQWRSLTCRCWETNPNKRPSFVEIRETLQSINLADFMLE